MEKIKLGILGMGNIGNVHANNIIDGKCPEIELTAACDLKAEKLNELKEKSPSTIMFDDAEKMMDSLEIAAIVTHVADARTCVLHPASHTHRQMNDEQLIEAGVQPDLIRLSVGIENVDDIIADLEQAIEKA